ncbi:MAG TPA: hypothetical protein VFE54_06695 [Mucilaginibacter sp.]|jgi:hypothetical protein|nr:hypothetical protein [Mucilaginibacter sp.]
MLSFEQILSGGDLRSIGRSNTLVSKITDQQEFDQLFKLLFHSDRLVMMRAADAMEKVTIDHPEYLSGHSKEIINLSEDAENKELKWHLALLIPRFHLDGKEFEEAWGLLVKWAKDKTNSRTVRVNAIQGLFELARQNNGLLQNLKVILSKIKTEDIPSLNARIKKISKFLI